MAAKDYESDGIVVHWRSSRCIHSQNCVHGLPEVFDRDARPWIRADGAPADRLADAVDRCPSRALTYTRTDGAAPGPNAERDDEDSPSADGATVVVNVKPNGPLALVGLVHVIDTDGNLVAADDRTFLCRCGGSANKPFCDGSHKAIGFTG